MQNNDKKNNHISVLLNESINSLNIKPNGIYVDGTLGRGGHSKLILSKLNNDGRLICIDQDSEAIKFCETLFQNDKRVTIIKNNFCNIDEILINQKIDYVDGVLLDLGVSSPQLDNSERGFSYNNSGPLDMRMDTDKTLSAYEVLNTFSYDKLCKIFYEYGDIKNPKLLVNNILKIRSKNKIETTTDFFNIIKQTLPPKIVNQNHNFANNYFQALRIFVNDEINNLKTFLNKIGNFLRADGVISIITFHSLEDKIVLNKYKELSRDLIPKEVPLSNMQQYQIINFKGFTPTEDEIKSNKRSRSAKLRTIKKLF